MASAARPTSLDEFYSSVYVKEHRRTATRALHVLGTCAFIAQACAALATRRPALLLSGVVSAYGCAWTGHFFIEHNRPATFKHPWWSLLSDFRMCYRILTRKESLREVKA